MRAIVAVKQRCVAPASHTGFGKPSPAPKSSAYSFLGYRLPEQRLPDPFYTPMLANRAGETAAKDHGGGKRRAGQGAELCRSLMTPLAALLIGKLALLSTQYASFCPHLSPSASKRFGMMNRGSLQRKPASDFDTAVVDGLKAPQPAD
jgi:hypothetical protein